MTGWSDSSSAASTDEFNEAFVDFDSINTGSEATASSDSTWHSLPSNTGSDTTSSEISNASVEMRRILNELAEHAALIAHPRLRGHAIPPNNMNQVLPPFDHFSRFKPFYLAISPPKVVEADIFPTEEAPQQFVISVNKESVLFNIRR